MSSSNYGSRGPPSIEGMYSLKVDNLTYRTSPEDLRRTFEKFGDVGDVYIPRDRHSRESRGFAFVRFFDKRDAEDAMDSMDGYKLDGREIKCQMARYGRPTEPYRRGGRYGGGGGGGNGGGGGGSGRRGRSRSRSRSPRRRRSRERSYSRSRSRSRSDSRSKSRENRSKSAEQNGADVSE